MGYPGGTSGKENESESRSVISDSQRPHGLNSPWNSPGKNTGVGNLSLLQGIFPTEGWNSPLPHCRQILYQVSHKGSPCGKEPAGECRRYKQHGFHRWVERSPGGGKGNPLQYSCLENPMGRGVWQAKAHGVPRVRHDVVNKPLP